MAFQTTQYNNTALFRNLFFRTSDNAPISSLYILNTNGRGETFWSKTVTPENVSTFSSIVGSTYSSYETEILDLNNSFSIASTQTIPVFASTFTGEMLSTFGSQIALASSLGSNFIAFSNQQITHSNSLITSLVLQTNQVYISSLAIAQSTVASLSDPSTFNRQLSSLYSTINVSFSTLSTAISLTSQLTLQNMSSYLTRTMSTTYLNNQLYSEGSVFQLSNILLTDDVLNFYGNQYEIAQDTAFQDLAILDGSQYSTQFTNLSSILSTQSNYTSTNTQDTLYLTDAVANLVVFSDSISTIVSTQVSSLVDGVFAIQDQKLSNYYSTLTNEVSSISSYAHENSVIVSTLSTFTYTSVSTINSESSTIYTGILSLTSTFSTINISSILGNVYSVFNLFEIFCNDIVLSTTGFMNHLQSTVFYSTILQNNSTTNNFFSTLFQDPFTTSTVQTVSTQANHFLSSYIVSTLVPGNLYIQSSLQSTIVGKTQTYNSTVNSLFSIQISTYGGLFQSSVLNNLSSPTGALLSTVSTLGWISLSTFQQQATSSIQAQNTGFSNQFGLMQSLQSTLFQTSVFTNLSLQSSIIINSTLYNALFSTMRTSSIQQISSISNSFISSLASYETQFNTMIVSTPSAYVGLINTNTATSLALLQTSSIQTYSTAITVLQASISTLAFSTLYTEQRFRLFGSTYQATLDFANFTNFYININDPLISGTTSSYRISYNSNIIGTLPQKTGIITVDVSTPTSAYTNNGSQLGIELYQSGLPTTIWSEIYPSISTSDYVVMYEYYIQNSIVYTNLLNVYPRVTHGALSLLNAGNTGVVNSFWRGSDLGLSWSNFSYFPVSLPGIPAYRSELQIDLLIGNQVFQTYGPYDISVSSATIMLPRLSGSLINPVPAILQSYVIGNPVASQSLPINIILPQWDTIQITPQAGNFLAIADINAFSDTGGSILTSTNTALLDGSGNTNARFEMRAMEFNGSNAYLTVPGSSDFAFGTGDFTIEWFLYYRFRGNNTYPRIVSIGTFPAVSFAFSIETGGFIINRPTLVMGATYYNFPIMTNAINNRWSHMALTRQGGQLRFFLDGVLVGSLFGNYNMTDGVNPLVIGQETNTPDISYLHGYLTNLHWVSGTALYTGNFTPPTRPISPVANTKLLLLASSSASLLADSSGTGKVVTNTNVVYPTFFKSAAFDNNPSTFTVGPVTVGQSTIFSAYRVNSQLQTTLTSLSSITIRNIDPSERILRGSTRFDRGELQNAQLSLSLTAGTDIYTSTITLRSTQLQTYFF